MLLSITTTHQPATDLGYLLHKHPDKAQSFSLNFGQAHVFYPEANAERCTAVLLLDVDPIKLVRKQGRQAAFALQPYVNDRPYVASSFMSTAIAQVYGTALNGRCKEKPDMVDTPFPFSVEIGVLSVRGGEGLLPRLFEPLGYGVTAVHHPLDTQFPDWGSSRYFTVTLENTLRLHELLSHLYVLMPVLDDDKHYWIGEDEVEKLLNRGEGWLNQHPEREEITRRYLKHYRHLTRAALAQLTEEDDPDPDTATVEQDALESEAEKKVGLHQQRLTAVLETIKNSGAHTVLDLGCGEGKLLRLLLKDKQFTQILGMDVSHRSLEIAKERLRFERMSEAQQKRITLRQGSLMYRDPRIAGFDAAAVVEVIEHLDPPRLAAFERVLFEFARPETIVITTPNQEYNVMWPSLPAGQFRHRDHRFEWTRAEFEAWSQQVAARFGYTVQFAPLGPEDESVGAPSQMGIFTRNSKAYRHQKQTAYTCHSE